MRCGFQPAVSLHHQFQSHMKKAIFSFLAVMLFIGSGLLTAGNEKESNNNTLKSSISGKVLDYLTSESLAGVEVQIQGTNLKTYTDLDGNFSFSGLVPGEYEITTSMISYREKAEKVQAVPGPTELKIRIETVGR